MRCKNCIAFGRDFISRLCVAGNSIEIFSGEYGCRKQKQTIEKQLSEELKKKPTRYMLFRKEWEQ